MIKSEIRDSPRWVDREERHDLKCVVQNRSARLQCNWEVVSGRGVGVEADIKVTGM